MYKTMNEKEKRYVQVQTTTTELQTSDRHIHNVAKFN